MEKVLSDEVRDCIDFLRSSEVEFDSGLPTVFDNAWCVLVRDGVRYRFVRDRGCVILDLSCISPACEWIGFRTLMEALGVLLPAGMSLSEIGVVLARHGSEICSGLLDDSVRTKAASIESRWRDEFMRDLRKRARGI